MYQKYFKGIQDRFQKDFRYRDAQLKAGRTDRCGKTKEQKEHSSKKEMHQAREDLKGFTIASKKIPHFVNLKSALIELKKSASRWTRTGRKISPIE